MSPDNDDWNTGHKSGLVSIGSHKLHAAVDGPDRQPGEAVIILVPGVTSTIAEWPVAISMIAQTARIFSYDRSGYGESEESPNAPSPANIAAELRALLDATGIAPPYITLGHSWGGVLTSEFMAAAPDDIAGMVFADASAPDPTPGGVNHAPWKHPAVAAVAAGLDYRVITGLEANCVLAPQQWRAWMDEEDSAKHERQAEKEMGEVDDGFAPMIARKLFDRKPPLLGRRPVCVVKAHPDRDFKALYAAGLEAGNGTEGQRETYRRMLEGWEAGDVASQRQYLTLSENNHYLETKWCGHNLQVMEPEMVVAAVKWVLQNLEKD